jgi:hypothetical protein
MEKLDLVVFLSFFSFFHKTYITQGEDAGGEKYLGEKSERSEESGEPRFNGIP